MATKEIALTLGFEPLLAMDVYERDDTGRIVKLLHSKWWPATEASKQILAYCDGDTRIRRRDIQSLEFKIQNELSEIVKEAAKFAQNYGCTLGLVAGRITPPSGFEPIGTALGKARPRGETEMQSFIRDRFERELRRLQSQIPTRQNVVSP